MGHGFLQKCINILGLENSSENEMFSNIIIPIGRLTLTDELPWIIWYKE